jgi:hypothetical protein
MTAELGRAIIRGMRTLIAALALVLAGCAPPYSGPSNNDPVRFGTLRVALNGIPDAVGDEALAKLSRLGPAAVRATGTADVTVSVASTAGGCVAVYDHAARSVTMDAACFGTRWPGAESSLVAHAVGHILGLAHVCLQQGQIAYGTTPPCSPVGVGSAIMNPGDYLQDGTMFREVFRLYTYEATQLDLDEYARTHP